MPKPTFILVLVALAGLLCLGSPAAAGDLPNQCAIAKDKAEASVNGYYKGRIDQVASAIQDIKDAGGNPNDIAIRVGDELLTLPQIEARLKQDQRNSLASVASSVDECKDGVKPYQDVVDAFADVLTGGLAGALPGKMGHVDASDILAGYPLGGKDALIPKAREDALKFLGIGGKNNDIAKVIRDPLRPIRCLFGC